MAECEIYYSRILKEGLTKTKSKSGELVTGSEHARNTSESGHLLPLHAWGDEVFINC